MYTICDVFCALAHILKLNHIVDHNIDSVFEHAKVY